MDPVLPSDCIPEISMSMYREIMNDVPMKLVKPKFTGEARKQLSKYCEAAKKLMEVRGTNSESRKLVKWNVEDTFSWLRRTVGASYEDFQERLQHLKRECQPHITDAAKGSVEGICKKIYTHSVDYSQKINEKNQEILKEATSLRYKGEVMKLNNLYFNKLEQLYRYGCADDRKFDYFVNRVWCLLKRYQCYFGNTFSGE